ncbi:MAG: HNH endonuclease [Pyrinomonadaceae bacterium]|nr:HNH endonuclease [Pyrinomonadaceae bacterium]
MEHILPQTPDFRFWDVAPEQAEAYCSRIGNLVLLTAEENSRLGKWIVFGEACSFQERVP